jgi:hypothetical protein
MAADIDLGDDDGFINLTIGDVTVTLDVWEINDKLYALHQSAKDKGDDAYGDALLGFIQGLGYPPCSRRIAQRFVEAIGARVKELAGNP